MKKIISLLLVSFFASLSSYSAETDPIILQAENATLGADWLEITVGGITFIEPTSDVSSTDSGNPNTAARVASFSVTFPKEGTWDLYAKVWVGPDTFGDDSLFYAKDFGTPATTDDDAWIDVNNLASTVGYSSGFVLAAGNAAELTWKWVKLSSYNDSEPGENFLVEAEALTQSFEIGAREDGLRIDKMAFGFAGENYTVTEFESGVADGPPPPGTNNTVYTRTGLALANGKSKWLGNVWSTSQESNFTNYWNQVTPENTGKWGSVEATRDSMVWAGLDTAYNLAKDNGIPFRFHVLIWGNQQPSWMDDGSLTNTEQLEEIEEWMDAVAARYPNIDYIEVVNEALNAEPLYKEALGGDGTTGWDWIITAFTMAREKFPHTKLVINDYRIINEAAYRADYLEIIGLLQTRNLIDVIGLQCHSFNLENLTAAQVTTALDDLAATGLPIMITEMDLDGMDTPDGNSNDVTYLSDQVQLDRYQRIFPAIFEHPSVEGITLWGWRPGLWRADTEAQLIMTQGNERPAMEWLVNYMSTVETINFAEFLESHGLNDLLHTFSADVDGDGLSTGLEYLLNLDPDSQNRFLVDLSISEGNPLVILPVLKGMREGYLAIQSSADLASWTNIATYDFATGTPTSLELTEVEGIEMVSFVGALDGENNSIFYRFRFWLADPDS